MIFNHAFLDGNKRTAIASAALMMFINGYELKVSNQMLESFTLMVVTDRLEIQVIADWLRL